MKYCGGCKAREATEKVIFQCADGQHVTARFCPKCWEQFRAQNGDDLRIVGKTTGGGTS